jgi:hypothetical protein
MRTGIHVNGLGHIARDTYPAHIDELREAIMHELGIGSLDDLAERECLVLCRELGIDAKAVKRKARRS